MVISRVSFVFLFIVLGMLGYVIGSSFKEVGPLMYAGAGLICVGALPLILVLKRLERWQVVGASFLALPLYWGVGKLTAMALS